MGVLRYIRCIFNVMGPQEIYYNKFAVDHWKSILNCPDPEYWTTDYESQGRVYQEMKKRVDVQKEWIKKLFDPAEMILDIGCGFGRQAFWMAKAGYNITGIDTSGTFVKLAEKLFEKHHLTGNFIYSDVYNMDSNEKFKQVLLLDVLEHIPPVQRIRFLERISQLMLPNGILFVSLPLVKDRLRSRINNARKLYTSFFSKNEEHPYPIPTKKKINKLMGSLFNLKEAAEVNDTGFYIFERK